MSSIEDSDCYPSYRWFPFMAMHESVRRHPVTTGIPSRKRRPLTLISDGTRTHFRSQRLVSMKMISYRSQLFPLFCMAGESLVPETGSSCRSLRRTDILLLLLLCWLLLSSDDWDGDSSSYVPLRRLCSESTSQQKINNNSSIEVMSRGWAISTVTNCYSWFMTIMEIQVPHQERVTFDIAILLLPCRPAVERHG